MTNYGIFNIEKPFSNQYSERTDKIKNIRQNVIQELSEENAS